MTRREGGKKSEKVSFPCFPSHAWKVGPFKLQTFDGVPLLARRVGLSALSRGFRMPREDFELAVHVTGCAGPTCVHVPGRLGFTGFYKLRDFYYTESSRSIESYGYTHTQSNYYCNAYIFYIITIKSLINSTEKLSLYRRVRSKTNNNIY